MLLFSYIVSLLFRNDGQIYKTCNIKEIKKKKTSFVIWSWLVRKRSFAPHDAGSWWCQFASSTPKPPWGDDDFFDILIRRWVNTVQAYWIPFSEVVFFQDLGFCSFVCFLPLSIREASRIQHNGPARRNGIKQGQFQERGKLEMGLRDVFAWQRFT